MTIKQSAKLIISNVVVTAQAHVYGFESRHAG